MLEASGIVVLGLLLLIFGGELLLRGAVGLATLLRLTPAVIGLTVVAAGTSVPELAVSVIAGLRGSADIAVGNVIGSNIFNITVVLGASALVAPLLITGNTVRLEYPVMALVSLLFVVVAADGVIGRLDALLFVAVYVTFTAYMVGLVRRQLAAEEAREMGDEVRELAAAANPAGGAWRGVAFVAGGCALLALGADVTVRGATTIARLAGLSERVIGLTIVAAGTSLPEVVTSVVSSLRGRTDVAIANAFGSNLFNILAILGITGLIAPLPVAASFLRGDTWWLLGTALLLCPLLLTRKRLSRIEGALLFGSYLAYVTTLLRR